MLHLDVDAPPVKLHLDIFIALDLHALHRQRDRRQEALYGVQMLEKVAAMYGLDPNKLCRI
jgi:hypothetical protein